MIIGFNHNYYLRHDNKRTILASNPKAVKNGYVDEWLSRIHPLYAMLFAILSEPLKKTEAVQRIANFFGITHLQAEDLLSPFLKKEGILAGDYGNSSSYFPKSIIREYTEQESKDFFHNKSENKVSTYNPADFKFTDIDLDTHRMLRCPHGLVFIITTNCATNCIYCYADKTTKCSKFLSIQDIERILKEAKDIGIKEIQLIGGEFFLHPNWYEILSISRNLGFINPLISTKLPLTKDQLNRFKEFDIRLQISLDSIDSKLLKDTLLVSDSYRDQIIKSIEYADRLDIQYKIASVLTRKTANIENLLALYNFIKTLKHINLWTIRLAFRSLYTNHSFEDIKVTETQFDQLNKWYQSIRQNHDTFAIEFPDKFNSEYQYAKNGSQEFRGNRCSANMSHMVILPNGDVTICEQLYWNRRFIIGNILNENIEQIWNGTQAISLANWQKREISSQSACSNCSIYDVCRDFSNKCFANTIKAYGDNNWDYPDPRCFYAPPFLNDIT